MFNGQQGMDFFPGRSVIMDYGLIFWPEVMVKLTFSQSDSI